MKPMEIGIIDRLYLQISVVALSSFVETGKSTGIWDDDSRPGRLKTNDRINFPCILFYLLY